MYSSSQPGVSHFSPSKVDCTNTSVMLVIVLLILALVGCGGAAGNLTGATPAPTTSGTVPASSHVVLVVEENHSYSSVIGNSSMPYLNGLASQYGLATQYFADAHPSIPNYFMLTTGEIVTIDDGFTGTVSADNVVRKLTSAGKSWRYYAESLPTVGYTGGDSGRYLKRHNPFAYLTDVLNSSSQTANLVPFSQFSADLSANALPNFSFIVPNLDNDAHDGTLAQADSWLQTNLAPLLASGQFQQDGLLIILFDEGDTLDVLNFGGHVAAVLIGPKVKHGFRSTSFYQHESTLRTILQALGVNTFPGNAASAPAMTEFFP